MCRDCVDKPAPNRGTTCLSAGAYLLNLRACAACGRRGFVPSVLERRVRDRDDERRERAARKAAAAEAAAAAAAAAVQAEGEKAEEKADEEEKEKAEAEAKEKATAKKADDAWSSDDDDDDNDNDNDDDSSLDDDELVTFKHACPSCSHVIAVHRYAFRVDGAFQNIAMQCRLCGNGQRHASVAPCDPRETEKYALF